MRSYRGKSRYLRGLKVSLPMKSGRIWAMPEGLYSIFPHITKDKYRTMLVGTGDVPSTLRFYENNGFTLSHRIPGFLYR